MKRLLLALVLFTLPGVARPSAEYTGGVDGIVLNSASPDTLTNFTWSMWIYQPTGGTGERYLVARWTDGSNNRQFYVGVFNSIGNVLQAGIPFLSWGIVTGGTAITADTWHHVAVTRSGNNWTIWLDGAIDGGPSTDATAAESGGTFALMNSITAFNIWIGKLAEVAAWNAVLSTAEIQSLAKGTPPNRVRASFLHYYWPLHTRNDVSHVWPDLGGGGWNSTPSVNDAISDHAPMSPPAGAE